MVVNNQGRIGKALIPCFVLFHLLEGLEGVGEGARDTGFMVEWMLLADRL